MIRLMVLVIIVVVFVGVSYILMVVTVSVDVVPYAIVMWASPALNAFIGSTPLPMLYV